MKMTVIYGEKDNALATLSYSAQGKIREVPTNNGQKYVLAMFDQKFNGRTAMFQKAFKEGDKCVVESDDSYVEGTYLMSSRIDGNPIIVVNLWKQNGNEIYYKSQNPR